MSRKPRTPPTIPPIIAPLLLELEELDDDPAVASDGWGSKGVVVGINSKEPSEFVVVGRAIVDGNTVGVTSG